jgi:hypothetical protein
LDALSPAAAARSIHTPDGPRVLIRDRIFGALARTLVLPMLPHTTSALSRCEKNLEVGNEVDRVPAAAELTGFLVSSLEDPVCCDFEA